MTGAAASPDGDGVNVDFVEVPRPDGSGPPWRIARLLRRARGEGLKRPGLVWLGGFGSDMRGAKAERVDAFARESGRAFLRFDYSGHGESDGAFEEGTIGDWLEQSLALFENSTDGPQIIVASSMGAWIALLLARRLAERDAAQRLRALVLLAPAVDFTEELIWKNLDGGARRELETTGVWLRPSEYSLDPLPITRRLIEDGRRRLLMGGVIRAYAPVHILQGMADADAPWRHALALSERLAMDPLVLTFISDGDHRLSREEDLRRLLTTIESID